MTSVGQAFTRVSRVSILCTLIRWAAKKSSEHLWCHTNVNFFTADRCGGILISTSPNAEVVRNLYIILNSLRYIRNMKVFLSFLMLFFCSSKVICQNLVQNGSMTGQVLENFTASSWIAPPLSSGLVNTPYINYVGILHSSPCYDCYLG